MSSRQLDHGHRFGPERDAPDSNTITTDVVDGFERKSFELLEYINTLEAKLEQQRRDLKQKEKQLEEEKICVEQKLEIDLQHAQLENARLQQDHHNFVEETERTIQSLRKDVDATDSSLRKERRRVQDLENSVTDLKHQLLQKQQSYSHQKAIHEKQMDSFEEHVNMLRKRVSLGWILGHLTEACLRTEPLQQAGGASASREGKSGKTVNMHRIEKEVRYLVDYYVRSPKTSDTSAPAQPGRMSSDDEGSESEKDDEFDRRIRNLCNAGKQRSTVVDAEVSPSKARQLYDELGPDYIQRDTQIIRDTQTRTGDDGKPVTKSTNSHDACHSKSPLPATHKSITSSKSPPRSPTKDVTWINESSAAINSSSLSHKDIARSQRDIQNLFSILKSKTKMTSSTNFRREV